MDAQIKELRVSNDAKNDPEELRRRVDDEGYLFFKQLLNPDSLLELRKQILTTLQEGGWLISGTNPMDGITDVTKKCTEGDRKYTDVYHEVQKLEALHRSAHWPETLNMIEKRVQSNKEYVVQTTEAAIQAQAASYNSKSNQDDSDDDSDDGYRADGKN